MRIVSWNVNGLRALLRKKHLSLKELLDDFRADIICMQETKASRSPLDHDVAIADGYSAYFSFCKIKQGYSGVVTFCRESATPIAAEEGVTGHNCRGVKDHVGSPAKLPELTEQELCALDSEGRAILTEHAYSEGDQRLVVINIYSPRVDPESCERLPYKLNFFTALRERCRELEQSGRNVLVAGDLNCLLGSLDSAVAQEMPTFPRESEARQLLKKFVSPCNPPSLKDCPDCLLVDSFRHLHPNQKEAYSCWCTKTDSRKLNYGQRIDFILLSPKLVPYLTESAVHAEIHGSDHCPVSSEFSFFLLPASSPPSSCSCYFAEFAGKQSKLLSFFGKKSDSAASREEEHPTSNPSLSSPSLSSDVMGTTCGKTRRSNGSTSANKRPRKMPQTIASMWNKGSSSVSTSKGSTSISTSNDSSAFTEPPVSSTNKLSSEWSGVFDGGPKVPVCTGHGEPAVLRTVKKSGPNKDRKFYVCCRPDGAKNDPNSRCNFFKWTK